MKVTCDKCNTIFKVIPEVKNLEDDLQQEYFKCTNCNEEYNIIKTNAAARKLRAKVEEDQDHLGNREDLKKELAKIN